MPLPIVYSSVFCQNQNFLERIMTDDHKTSAVISLIYFSDSYFHTQKLHSNTSNDSLKQKSDVSTVRMLFFCYFSPCLSSFLPPQIRHHLFKNDRIGQPHHRQIQKRNRYDFDREDSETIVFHQTDNAV